MRIRRYDMLLHSWTRGLGVTHVDPIGPRNIIGRLYGAHGHVFSSRPVTR